MFALFRTHNARTRWCFSPHVDFCVGLFVISGDGGHCEITSGVGRTVLPATAATMPIVCERHMWPSQRVLPQSEKVLI